MNPRIAGIMLDSARLTEPYSYYEQLIPRLSRWGYNTLFLHLCDDEGCSIQLQRNKVLHTPGAFTIEQWKRLLALAREHGLEVIPEVECLGHTGYLTRLEAYRELREPPADGVFWSIKPLHHQVLERLFRILEEVYDIFRPRFIHIGMDEADIGGGEDTRQLLQTMSKPAVFAAHLNAMHRKVRELGANTVIWGDHLLSNEEVAARVEKDIIVCNWLYGYDYAENYLDNSRYLLERGFSILGCPAGMWNGTLFAPNRDNFENISSYSLAMEELKSGYGERILGMVNTLWTPYRTLPAILYPIMQYGAKIFIGKSVDLEWLEEYCSERFGVDETAAGEMARALKMLFFQRWRTKLEVTMMPGNEESLQGAAEIVVRYSCNVLADLAEQIGGILSAIDDQVKQNRSEFMQWVATVEMIRRVAQLAEGFHRQSPAGPIGKRRRGENSKSGKELLARNALAISDEVRAIRDFWEGENRKVRDHLGVQAEQVGADPLFWDLAGSDHPLERLRITETFMRSLASPPVKVYQSRAEMGRAAALDVEEHIHSLLKQQELVRIIFAAAPSQNELLEHLATSTTIDWSRIEVFHMDEYIGLSPKAPQAFSRFLRDRLFDLVQPKRVQLIDGTGDPETECRRYANLINTAPVDIVCLGIGENGHLAFNDPPVADFHDPLTVKMVELDSACRQQQVNDGCFPRVEDVPSHAITLTIPALMAGKRLFCVVPGASKRAAVASTLHDPMTPACPATILRSHPHCTLYLDRDAYPGSR